MKIACLELELYTGRPRFTRFGYFSENRVKWNSRKLKQIGTFDIALKYSENTIVEIQFSENTIVEIQF